MVLGPRPLAQVIDSLDLNDHQRTVLKERYEAHLAGKACRTTKLDPPVSLVYREEFQTFSGARRHEAQVKHWSRAEKEALVSSDLETLRQLAKPRKP
jgi:predicted GIY-YIG superfamily endonuclease